MSKNRNRITSIFLGDSNSNSRIATVEVAKNSDANKSQAEWIIKDKPITIEMLKKVGHSNLDIKGTVNYALLLE